jgi:hypothetical protein
MLTIAVVTVAAYLNFFHFDKYSIQQAIASTVGTSVVVIGNFLTIIKPDFFIKKPMVSYEAWLIRILGAAWVILGSLWIKATWETYYMWKQLGL